MGALRVWPQRRDNKSTTLLRTTQLQFRRQKTTLVSATDRQILLLLLLQLTTKENHPHHLVKLMASFSTPIKKKRKIQQPLTPVSPPAISEPDFHYILLFECTHGVICYTRCPKYVDDVKKRKFVLKKTCRHHWCNCCQYMVKIVNVIWM